MDVLIWGDTEALPSQLVARADALAELTSALEPGRSGAVVVGPAGVGKTALVRAAAARSSFHIVNVRGSRFSAQTPFGALAWLLSDLPEGIDARPVQLLQQLEELLARRSGDLPVLLLLDNAEHLDEFTAMAVAQLVRRSAVRVLATASDLAASAADFLALWTEGLLHRIDLAPFDLGETRALMESLLDGRVSSVAAQSMLRHSGGNPHLIQLTTPAQAGAGSLVQQDGVWVLARPLVYPAQVAEVMTARLKRLTPQERAVVELLALAGELPLSVVLRLARTETVEALEEARMLEIAACGTVLLAGAGTSPAMAGSIPPGRSRELWERVSGQLDPADLGPGALEGFANWTMACRGSLAPETALRAAELANAAEDPVSALKFLRAVPARQHSPAMVLEEARALAASGDCLQALREIERCEAVSVPADHRTRIGLMMQKAALLQRLPARGDVWTALDEVAAALATGYTGQEPAAPDLESAELHAELTVLRGVLAIDAGRFSEVPADLARIPSAPELPAGLRARATALRAHALALTGRADEALALAATLAKDGDSLPAGTRNQVTVRMFYALVSAGELGQAGELASGLADGGRRAFRGSSGEVVEGIVHALAGRTDQALRALTSSISQLRLHDPADILPLAQALAAYSCAEQEDYAAAKQYLADAAEFTYPPPAPIGYLTARARLQAELAEDPETLGRELRAMARSCSETGMVSSALECLTAAARCGDPNAAQELAEAAKAADGAAARAAFCLGAGLARADPALLLEAAQQFLDLDNHLLCHAASGAALTLLQGRHSRVSRAHAQTARRLEQLSFRQLRDANSLQARWETLSPFEADLARRAAGSATREKLGRELSLSPRTIDWHLGKIFDKLRVSGRSELIEILR